MTEADRKIQEIMERVMSRTTLPDAGMPEVLLCVWLTETWVCQLYSLSVLL